MSEISVIKSLEAEYEATKLFKERLRIPYSLPPYFSDRFESCFDDIGPHILFGAFEGKELLGASLSRLKSDFHDRSVLHVDYLAVKVEHERRGVGPELLERSIELARNTGTLCAS